LLLKNNSLKELESNVLRGGLEMSDRLTVCRQNGVADTSTRVDFLEYSPPKKVQAGGLGRI